MFVDEVVKKSCRGELKSIAKIQGFEFGLDHCNPFMGGKEEAEPIPARTLLQGSNFKGDQKEAQGEGQRKASDGYFSMNTFEG